MSRFSTKSYTVASRQQGDKMNEIDATIGTMRRPSIHNLKLPDLPQEHRRMQEWGWVKIHDLAECLPDIVENFSIQNRAEEVFHRYGLICDKEEDEALFTWVYPEINGYVFKSDELPPFGGREGIFVPAGWANRAISLAESGIVRLTTSPEEFTINEQLAFRKVWIHQIIGHKVNGEKVVVALPGEFAGTTDEAPCILHLNH